MLLEGCAESDLGAMGIRMVACGSMRYGGMGIWKWKCGEKVEASWLGWEGVCVVWCGKENDAGVSKEREAAVRYGNT